MKMNNDNAFFGIEDDDEDHARRDILDRLRSLLDFAPLLVRERGVGMARLVLLTLVRQREEKNPVLARYLCKMALRDPTKLRTHEDDNADELEGMTVHDFAEHIRLVAAPGKSKKRRKRKPKGPRVSGTASCGDVSAEWENDDDAEPEPEDLADLSVGGLRERLSKLDGPPRLRDPFAHEFDDADDEEERQRERQRRADEIEAAERDEAHRRDPQTEGAALRDAPGAVVAAEHAGASRVPAGPGREPAACDDRCPGSRLPNKPTGEIG